MFDFSASIGYNYRILTELFCIFCPYELPSNPGEKISIHIEVTSNEFEDYQYDNGRKMLTIIERNNLDGPPVPVDRATLLLAPFT